MTQSGEFKRGWKVVLAACIGVGTGLSPLPFYTIGVFIRPLSAEFGWTVDQILFSLTVTTLAVLLAGPLVGLLTDRFGVRRVAIGSVIGYGVCFMLFALNPGSLATLYANYALLAVVGAGTLPITWTRAVNSWFKEQRGLALGLSLISTGIFGALAKLYANALIDAVGWRFAYVGLAAFPLLISLPVALAFFRERHEPQAQGQPPAAPESGLTLREALATRRFWTLSLAFVFVTLAVGGIIPNIERLMASKGFDSGTAVNVASLIGIAVLLGRPVGGWLMDRFWAPGVAFVLLAAPALAFVMLGGGNPTLIVAASAVFLIGFASGVEYDVVAYLVSRYFGMRAYSAIYGALYGAFVLGAGFGPYLIGRAFTAQKTYDGALLVAAIATVAGAAVLLTLGRYPKLETASAESAKAEPAGVPRPA